ncbi:MAG: polysulfide reductase NrfD [Deltaproteobacteria bacterium]|nr:polysulfide reductase NrfD [Deltaproteobacteria bacterium]MBW2139631.1 polysulfide reductase NrfD [Deltaproteobacteria bacterium]MBW2322257.1 polysulfide reductase NrfD [Deltaproteobacteria bacterium]
MLEKPLFGSKKYYAWMTLLMVVIGVGVISYLYQFIVGLGTTGMSRDVSWGFYIAQLTFLVGVAASAVMVVLPYYLHNYKEFGRITILGEFLAVSAILMCMLFVTVDLGKPLRLLNMFRYPTPNSILFWDVVVLTGYLLLNIVIGWITLSAEKQGVKPPGWIKPLIYLSIPWAVSIHTVTAFLYAGLPGRGYWLTAILAPRFLASAFAGGPAILILLSLLLKKFTKFDAGTNAIQTLAKIVTYAAIINIFFFFLEVFTVFYSQIPEHMDHFKYLFFGLHGKGFLIPFMWFSITLGFAAIAMLITPSVRKNEKLLALACVLVFISIWIDKGLALISAGFIPSPLHHVTEYVPTIPELLISLGIYGIGLATLTVLYKIALSVKEEAEA